MARYAMQIEYDGGPFRGWQRQSGLPSVQAAVEAAIARVDPSRTGVAAAGRTDSGVHAWGQVAHADLEKPWEPRELRGALNHHLKPLPVAVVRLARAGDGFHARFSAVERRYVFRLVARRAPVVHEAGKVWQVGHWLDTAAMRQAARHLIGRHDFTTFRASECQARSPVKTLDRLEIAELPYPGGAEYRFVLRARSFLHSQVRGLVGSLERVGAGAWCPEDMRAALHARDRAACGPVCPPQGLYLDHVRYPEDPFG